MKKIKIDTRSLFVACALSAITLVILIVGLATKIKNMDAFAATIVFQFGIAGLWTLSKLGAFKGIFSGTRKMVENKRRKFREKNNIKEETKKSWKPLGYIGPIFMCMFGLIEVIIYIIVSYI